MFAELGHQSFEDLENELEKKLNKIKKYNAVLKEKDLLLKDPKTEPKLSLNKLVKMRHTVDSLYIQANTEIEYHLKMQELVVKLNKLFSSIAKSRSENK